jgi:hypothetical protein
VKRLAVEAPSDDGQSVAWARALQLLTSLACEPWDAAAGADSDSDVKSAAEVCTRTP